jgi:hypothetical protein
MINGQTLASVLDKLITKSEVAKNARIQVQMPNGDLHDIAKKGPRSLCHKTL